MTRAARLPTLSIRHLTLSALATALMLAMAPVYAPAHAQVFSQAPYVPAPDPAVERLSSRIDALEADLRKATGRAEELSFAAARAQKAADDANARANDAEKTIVDLRDRIEKLETSAIAAPAAPALGAVPAPAVPGGGSGPSLDESALPADQDALLKAARDMLIDGQTANSRLAFATYVKRYPKAKDAGAAQYGVGETFMVEENYPAAIDAYGVLTEKYASAPDTPMGLVKLSRALTLDKKPKDACTVLTLLKESYPKAPKMTTDLAKVERDRAKCK